MPRYLPAFSEAYVVKKRPHTLPRACAPAACPRPKRAASQSLFCKDRQPQNVVIPSRNHGNSHPSRLVSAPDSATGPPEGTTEGKWIAAQRRAYRRLKSGSCVHEELMKPTDISVPD